MKKRSKFLQSLACFGLSVFALSLGVCAFASSPLLVDAENPSLREPVVPSDPDAALLSNGKFYFNYSSEDPVLGAETYFLTLENGDEPDIEFPNLIWLPYSVEFAFDNSWDTIITAITLVYSGYNPSMQASSVSSVYPFWGFTRTQNSIRDYYQYGADYFYNPYGQGNWSNYDGVTSYYGKNFLYKSGITSNAAYFSWYYMSRMFAPFVDRLRLMVANNLIGAEQGLLIYDDGFADGDLAGYQRGYNNGYVAGQNSVTNDLTAFTSLFTAIIDVPANVLNSLSPLAVWGTPLIYIGVTLLFAAALIWLIRRFI